MPTLLLPPRHTPDSQLIWRAAVAAGWATVRLPAWNVPTDLPTRDLAFYGEPLLGALVAQSLQLGLIEPPLDWLTTVPAEYLRRRIQFSTLAEARKLTYRAFIKPADDKAFRAQVYASGGALDASELYEPNLPVLIAEPVSFSLEYRCFVLEGRIQTLSRYGRNGELHELANGEDPHSPAAEDFARRVLDDSRIIFPPAVVLDVGLLSDGHWAVIECNPAWGSGIYACDPAKVLAVLKRTCVPLETANDEDRKHFVRRTAPSQS